MITTFAFIVHATGVSLAGLHGFDDALVYALEASQHSPMALIEVTDAKTPAGVVAQFKGGAPTEEFRHLEDRLPKAKALRRTVSEEFLDDLESLIYDINKLTYGLARQEPAVNSIFHRTAEPVIRELERMGRRV